jgi:hypothetical protein
VLSALFLKMCYRLWDGNSNVKMWIATSMELAIHGTFMISGNDTPRVSAVDV